MHVGYVISWYWSHTARKQACNISDRIIFYASTPTDDNVPALQNYKISTAVKSQIWTG